MYWMHYQAWALPLMLIGLVGVAALVAVLFDIRLAAPRGTAPPGGDVTGGAVRILAERLARGEIDEETYRQRLALLRNQPPSG